MVRQTSHEIDVEVESWLILIPTQSVTLHTTLGEIKVIIIHIHLFPPMAAPVVGQFV